MTRVVNDAELEAALDAAELSSVGLPFEENRETNDVLRVCEAAAPGVYAGHPLYPRLVAPHDTPAWRNTNTPGMSSCCMFGLACVGFANAPYRQAHEPYAMYPQQAVALVRNVPWALKPNEQTVGLVDAGWIVLIGTDAANDWHAFVVVERLKGLTWRAVEGGRGHKGAGVAEGTYGTFCYGGRWYVRSAAGRKRAIDRLMPLRPPVKGLKVTHVRVVVERGYLQAAESHG